ncbi:Kae1-associated kinase Bud32 [Candidatus Woesearchaeota archaeon]|nr:Kae1-associated kinase Bud32 [Candidatus Woesearchaeota archaeon]|tara:strand:+ start:17175 stop:17789 length:615 start_codon:yes stop_codon:yes gene_type:complete
MKQLIAQGAEAKLFLDDNIIKQRIKKSYRIKEIDDKLRKRRTRREAKVIQKLNIIGLPCPKLIKTDEKERLEIEFIDGDIIRDILEKNDYKQLCIEIGKQIAVMHDNTIIHGDLTTSNMILKEKIYFIDFGLSFFSHRIEDKAVDLHLLKQALESKHYKIWESCFEHVLKGYKESKDYDDVLKKLETVEKRGRYKRKAKPFLNT